MKPFAFCLLGLLLVGRLCAQEVLPQTASIDDALA